MTCKEILHLIDELLATGNHEAVDLMHVLSALRGPDNNNRALKMASTAVIRAAAFPLTYKTAKIFQAGMRPRYARFIPCALMIKGDEVDTSLIDADSHFATHISDAAAVLRLKMKMRERK